MERPSKKQRELLSFIEAFIKTHGYGPSYREIMRGVGYRSVSTVAIHVDNLITKGHLRKRTRSARSLEVCAPLATAAPTAAPVGEDQEKWLVGRVHSHFKKAEAKAQKPAEIDKLYVLVGALHILGLQEAAASFKSRLQSLVAPAKEVVDPERN